MKKSSRRLLPDPKVCARYGVHPSTLWNWDHDPEMKFPKPIRIKNRKYRDEEELDRFDRDLAAERDATEAA
jgi:predicted DNA-binding transcriptional regulator AlpA